MRFLVTLTALLSLQGCDRISGKASVEEAVAQSLIDPTSPLFRGTERCIADRDIWQGEVNGKNRFGAYVGFERFFYANGTVAIGYDHYDYPSLFNRCYGVSANETATDDVINEDAPTPSRRPSKLPEIDHGYSDSEAGENLLDEEGNLKYPGDGEPTPTPSALRPDPDDPTVLGFVARNFSLA